MSVLTEVTHRVAPVTHKAFDAYVEIYCADAIPAMQRHGYEILGGWKWSSDRIGNDLMLIRFASNADRDKAEASLLGDTAVLARLRDKFAKAGVRVGEDIKHAEVLPHATEQRLQHAIDTSNPNQPRQFWLTRANMPLNAAAKVLPLLSDVANDIERAGTRRLVLTHRTTVGNRGEITHLWASAVADLHYAPHAAESNARGELAEYVTNETTILLNPLPYSPLQ